MPLLSYSAITDYPFQPFTKIYSADTNAMFATISTLLNSTLLDRVNIQVHGLTRYTSSSNLAAGTANYVVFNDGNGDLTEAAQLPTAQGGLGFAPTISGGTAGNALVVNNLGTGFTLAPVPALPALNVYNFQQFS